MDLVLLAVWGVATGVSYAAIAHRVDHAPGRRGRAHDFYAIAWYGLAATSFLLAAYAGALWSGTQDVALLATVRLGLVLSFVLAVAALLAAGVHFLANARRRALAGSSSPHPQG